MREKFQIYDTAELGAHAGSKATVDVEKIAEQQGFASILVHVSRGKSVFQKIKLQASFAKEWKKAYQTISANSIVLLQHPFRYRQMTREKALLKLKKHKDVKFISLIHDVEELRKALYNEYYKSEFDFMLEIADVLIVHNEKMRHFFIEKGVSIEKLVCLEIFDYLQEVPSVSRPQFDKSISIAGNLDIQKCPYIGKLGEISSVKFYLYGPNFNSSLKTKANITYCGSFPADEIPNQLNKGFGLVWDGIRVDTCDGDFGRYLRYNNPHKLSLYLSSGLPVIIWSGAAEAEFVQKNNCGICVNSLQDVEHFFHDLTEEAYNAYAESVAVVQKKMCAGGYTKEAIEKAIRLVE